MNYRRNIKKARKTPPTKNQPPVRRGDIYYADLSSATIGSEQGGTRPVLIIQNNKGNLHSPTVISAAITSQNKRGLPTHIELENESYGLSKNSTIMLEQIRTIDKTRLRDKIGHLDKEMMDKVNKAILISFGIESDLNNQNKNMIIEPEIIKKENKDRVKERHARMRKHKSEISHEELIESIVKKLRRNLKK